MKIIDRNRVKIYDENGRLIEERDATIEDILDAITEKYEFEIELPDKSIVKCKLKKKT